MTQIAKRRNKVIETVNYTSEIANVKNITSLDKNVLVLDQKKDKVNGQDHIQNSGNDKKNLLLYQMIRLID